MHSITKDTVSNIFLYKKNFTNWLRERALADELYISLRLAIFSLWLANTPSALHQLAHCGPLALFLRSISTLIVIADDHLRKPD